MKVLCTVTVALALSCGGSNPTPLTRPAEARDTVGELQAPKPNFSPTPAARTLGAWLEAFNSEDEARIKEFVATYTYPTPDELVALRRQTGGFALITLSLESERQARFVFKAKESPTHFRGWLRVKDTDPALIEIFELEAVPPE
jgi:hypothetical protein